MGPMSKSSKSRLQEAFDVATLIYMRLSLLIRPLAASPAVENITHLTSATIKTRMNWASNDFTKTTSSG